MKDGTFHIFVGFDQVEAIAYHTLCHSILEKSSIPVSFHPVKQSLLPMYKRERNPKQSNEFSFTRFLVPYLMGYKGHALFMDLDMLVRVDIKELYDLIDPSKSVQVVKHDYTPSTEIKYLGAIQYAYPRKNWSSVMLFNCEHDHCKRLTPDYVNTAEALSLHRFHWTHEDYIGSLPIEWNHLIGDYEPNPDAKNCHWSIGGPYFNEYRNVEFSDEWRDTFKRMTYCAQLNEG